MQNLKQLLTESDLEKDLFAARYSFNTDHLHKLADRNHDDVTYLLTTNPHTPAKTLHKLALTTHHNNLYTIAQHPNADHRVLSYAAKHGDMETKIQVARHSNAHSDIIHELSKYPSMHHYVVHSPHASAQTLQKVAKSNLKYSTILGPIVDHPNTSDQTLRHIINHVDQTQYNHSFLSYRANKRLGLVK